MPAQKESGFTLIELMVVIVIIAVLATIGAVMYSSTQKAARISKRIGDLQAVQLALETYKASNGAYPRTDNVANSVGFRSECSQWVGVSSDQVVPGLVPQFMAVLPSDPQSNKVGTNCYIYNSNGTDYKFADYYALELADSDLSNQPQLIDPMQVNLGTCPTRTDVGRRWAVYSLGGRCF